MTPNEQTRFVKTLTEAVIKGILTDILNGNIPETWDELELRQLITDRFSRHGPQLEITQLAAYWNDVLINDL